MRAAVSTTTAMTSAMTAETKKLSLENGDDEGGEDSAKIVDDRVSSLSPPLPSATSSGGGDGGGSGGASGLNEFSKFGSYTIFTLILYELMLLPAVLAMTFMIYAGLPPRVFGCGRNDLSALDKQAACEALRALQNETNCVVTLHAEFESVAHEFGIYCERAPEIKTAITLVTLGSLIGAAIFGQTSDFYGRKRMLLVGHAGMFVSSLLTARAPTLAAFTALQMLTAVFAGGQCAISNVFIIENLPRRHRVWVASILNFTPNYIIFAGVSYLAHNWRTLSLISSALNVPAFCVLLIAFESPRWLIQKGKLERARFALRRIEKINATNSIERLDHLDTLIQQERKWAEAQARKRKYYFYHLFRTSSMSSHTLVIAFALVCVSTISFATMFNLETLLGSVYANIAILGCLRYSINIGVGVLDFYVRRAGRKPLLNALLAIVITLLGSIALVTMFTEADNHAAAIYRRIATLIATAFCSQMYTLYAIIINEIYPTAVRNVATSFITVFARLGGSVAPHIFLLATLWNALPFVFMFVLMAATLLLFNLFIPETKNTPLLDHLPPVSASSSSSPPRCGEKRARQLPYRYRFLFRDDTSGASPLLLGASEKSARTTPTNTLHSPSSTNVDVPPHTNGDLVERATAAAAATVAPPVVDEV